MKAIITRLWEEGRTDRGDVPGWVLITLMTAGLVAAIWAVAGPALVDLFDSAIDSVTGG
ncbi:MAG: hypothetical protein JW722_08955 [Demequinaceae bacterium]|nr:hypothetical protein [Demequinaceae bacterium]